MMDLSDLFKIEHRAVIKFLAKEGIASEDIKDRMVFVFDEAYCSGQLCIQILKESAPNRRRRGRRCVSKEMGRSCRGRREELVAAVF